MTCILISVPAPFLSPIKALRQPTNLQQRTSFLNHIHISIPTSHTSVQLLELLLWQIRERSDSMDHRGVQHLVLGRPYHVLREYPKSVQVFLSRIILLLVLFHENLEVFLNTHHIIVQEFPIPTGHLCWGKILIPSMSMCELKLITTKQ